MLLQLMPTERADELLSIGRFTSLAAHEHYIRAGQVPRRFAFAFSGLFRYVYVSPKGQEYTKGLVTEHRFVVSYSAMISAAPSHFYVEALESSEILDIPYYKWQALLASDVYWVRFLLRFVEEGFMAKEKRERELLLLDAETRYLYFLEESPGLDKRITQTIIASYLGIQPESLSRIRKKYLLLT